jgi:hypothetical protein
MTNKIAEGYKHYSFKPKINRLLALPNLAKSEKSETASSEREEVYIEEHYFAPDWLSLGKQNVR